MLVGTAHFVIPALMNCSLGGTSVRSPLSDMDCTHKAILENTGVSTAVWTPHTSNSLSRSILHRDTLWAQLQVRLSPLEVIIGKTLLRIRDVTVQDLLRKSERSSAQYLANLCELLL